MTKKGLQILLVFYCFHFIIVNNAMGQSAGTNIFHYTDQHEAIRLTSEGASHFARLAINCILRPYPNKTGHIQIDSMQAKAPTDLHPAFYGCFDWHSSVHGHWMLVRLLKKYPALPQSVEIRRRINQNLTPENIQGECEYFNQPSNRSFERMYGWAWLLKLAQELYTWDDPDGQRWFQHLQPLTDIIIERYLEFLPRLTYAINSGVHPNTAFGLSFALDYADLMGHQELKGLIIERSRFHFLNDRDCPTEWEPGGEDFFSPCLMEAELMSKVLDKEEFKVWFNNFFPDLDQGKLQFLLSPAVVSDRSDEKIVHLDGLNLSRAWCMQQIAKVYEPNEQVYKMLIRGANLHLLRTLPYVASGEYAGEHWLASFAVYALSVNED